MRSRISLALIGLSFVATPASAQDAQIDYEGGKPPAESHATATVVTHSEPAHEQVLPAQRVIPMRQTQPGTPVYVISPTIQPTMQAVQPGAQVVYAYPVQQAPSYYVQGIPATGTYGTVPTAVYAHPGAQVALPPGAQLVTFDRLGWLAECRKRLGIDLRDPATAAVGPDECESYLDDYMASAAAGRIQPQPVTYGQQYMLVPVTVLIPQQAVYREVE